MKIHYKIIETEEMCEENGSYIGYGLRCVCGAESAEVKNISASRKSAERLAAMLEREAVEPVHLFDVLYDLLADNALN